MSSRHFLRIFWRRSTEDALATHKILDQPTSSARENAVPFYNVVSIRSSGPHSERTLIQRFDDQLAIRKFTGLLTIHEKVIVWNVLSRPDRCSTIVSKVEHSSLDAKPKSISI